MINRIILSAAIIVIFVGCESKKFEALKGENDSLKKELDSRNLVFMALKNADRLLDSIDVNRRFQQKNIGGPIHQRLDIRLNHLNQYVKFSEKKISHIEKELKSARNESLAYLMMADALKGEVVIGVEEIEQLEDTLVKYQELTTGLSWDVQSSEAAMIDFYSQLHARETQLETLEEKIREMVKLTEAETYYVRAKSVEAKAQKLRLAPLRKRESFMEALELYRKAYSLGKKEAHRHILELEKGFAISMVADSHVSSE